MRVRNIAILGAVIIVLVVAALFVFSYIAEERAKTAKVNELVNEGFIVLDSDPDEAIRLALTARDIDAADLDARILLGRGLHEKKKYGDAANVFIDALNDIEDLDFLPELSYHAGHAYLSLYHETKIADDWQKAFRFFSDAANIGEHLVDANVGLGLLYCYPDYFDGDMVVRYLERAFEREADILGYPGSGEDGRCPNCKMEFKKKKEGLIDLYNRYAEK